MRYDGNLCPLLLLVIAALPCFGAASVPTGSQRTKLARVKDVATVEGVRDNQLIGYGIVVGLRGTGDSQQTVFPMQTLISTLERMGVNLQQSPQLSTMRTQNMASVFISAAPAASRSRFPPTFR